jgi:two-component system, OmpR family, sensor kinase
MSDADRLRLDRFVSTVAHDVRNPVTVVRASAQMAMRQARRGDTQGLLRGLDGIVQQSDRASDLLEAFAEAARIAAGSPLPLRPERMSLGELAERAVERSRHLLGQLAGREVEIEGDRDVGGVWDRERVVRAARALLDNAFLYGDPGRPVRVRPARRGGWAVLVVDGGGRGPDAAERPHLFECFFRGRAATESGHSGAGLGLYVARGIARAHGGDLRHDVAARFVLELPAER